jgi:signal transduction histidine kinase
MRPSIRPETRSFPQDLHAVGLTDRTAARLRKDPRSNRSSRAPDQTPGRAAEFAAALERLAGELGRVKEREKQGLAEHLHDEFGQDLVLAKMKLGLLSKSLPAKHRAEIKGVADIVDRLIHRTRITIRELYPQTLPGVGLKPALQSLTQEMAESHGLACAVRLDPMPVFNEEIQHVLFQSVRELLLNVIKHASASRVEIATTRKAGFVAIKVCDNGRGFLQHKPPLSGLSIAGFGLFSVRARLAAHGGELRIVSGLGKGTRATIAVPVAAPAGV